MMEQRQCSAFQPLTPVEYPLGINCHEAAPPESHTSRVPPKEQIMKTENVATSRICKCPKQALSVTAATILTYTLHNELKVTLNPVLSSGIVSITSTILLPEKLALAALCGSFAGMAKTSVVPTVWAAALLGVTCAAILAIFDRMEWFIGYGGRLGFVSQIACTLFFLAIELVSGRLGTDASKAMLADFDFYRDNATEIKSDLPFRSTLYACLETLDCKINASAPNLQLCRCRGYDWDTGWVFPNCHHGGTCILRVLCSHDFSRRDARCRIVSVCF